MPESVLNQICNQIDKLMSQKKRVILAIDGNCTAGKTTPAKKLAKIYDGNVFHMGDFFLLPEPCNIFLNEIAASNTHKSISPHTHYESTGNFPHYFHIPVANSASMRYNLSCIAMGTAHPCH